MVAYNSRNITLVLWQLITELSFANLRIQVTYQGIKEQQKRVGEEMSNGARNKTLPLPSPPQSQKEIIENNNDSLSKT